MSTGPGNDPFSGSNTRNILNHIISPKIVSNGTGGFTVKTDLINIDHVYSNDRGTITASGTTAVTITNPSVNANSVIILTVKTVSGTVGPAYVATATPGTGFTVKSASGDASTYNYLIMN
jgi:hypothetical protein